jgi:glycosyltransferase involved in cell wall biosynthesis
MDASEPAAAAALRVVRVLTRPNEGGPTRQAIALWHALRALRVHTLLVTGRVRAGETAMLPSAHGVPAVDLAAVLRGGVDEGWLELPCLGRAVNPFADWRAVRTLRACLLALRPDVVHTHTSKAGWIGRRAAWAARVPVVAHTFHGHVLRDYFAAPLAWLLTGLERRLAARTDALVAVSASCADELAAVGVAPRRLFTVVPPAVPSLPIVARPAARERLGIAPGAVRVACVARLVPIKRVERFVAAIRLLPGVGGDVIGDGPLRARLQAAAAGADVRFLGAIPDAGRWLAAYDALALSGRREGLPLVAVEAARAGVAVAGCDVPGVADAVAALGGELAPEVDGAAGLAAAIRRALSRTPTPDAAAAFAPAQAAQTLLGLYNAARRRKAMRAADRSVSDTADA